MFYKHSSIGGRIGPADASAYNPGGLNYGDVKDSGFVFGDKNQKVASDGSKDIALAPEIPKALIQTRMLQKHFLIEDGVPIYLKRGAVDVVAYRASMGLTGFGLVYLSYILYKMSYGIK